MKSLPKCILIIVALVILVLNYYDTCCARYSYRGIFFLGLLLCFFQFRHVNKTLYRFLLMFTIAECVSGFTFIHHYYDLTMEITFYLCNVLYIAAYTMLFKDILKRITSNNKLKKNWFSGIVLLCLGVYLWYSTMGLGLFSDVNSWLTFYDNLLIMLYMLLVMLIFSMTILNFIINPFGKLIRFSIGVVCITFSEIVSAASILDFADPATSTLSLTFVLTGFCLLFFDAPVLSRNMATDSAF